MTLDLHSAKYLWLDSFPNSVKKAGQEDFLTGTEYKVVVTNNRFYVFDDSVDGFVSLVSEPLLEFSGNYKDGFKVITTEDIYIVYRSEGCACGSRLRGFHPFLGVWHEARQPGVTVYGDNS